MSTPTKLTLPPRALHRRRAIGLACAGIGAATLIAATAGMLATQSEPGPLLLAIDELHVSQWNSEPAAEISKPSEIETAAIVVSEQAAAPVAVEQPTVSIETEQINPDWRTFNGRPIKPARTMLMEVTAYSPDARSCGDSADGITASGYSVWTNGMNLAAADTSMLPFGSLISVPGYDDSQVIPVLDRGGAIKGHRLDVLFPTHEIARQWGRQKLEVTVWEYADGLPNDFVTRHR